jgi:hypothetical protein
MLPFNYSNSNIYKRTKREKLIKHQKMFRNGAKKAEMLGENVACQLINDVHGVRTRRLAYQLPRKFASGISVRNATLKYLFPGYHAPVA